MNAPIVEAVVKASLADIRAKLEKGLRIAKAAESCAVSGRPSKGVEVALGLEGIAYELNTLLNATGMISRLGKS
jgi:hypothetical protein